MALLHPVFGQFVEDCRTIDLTPVDYKMADRLADVMSVVYPGKPLKTAVVALLEDYGIHLLTDTKINDSYLVDGHMCASGQYYVIVEIKNETGSSNSEAFCQAVSYYLEATRRTALTYFGSVLPCFLLVLYG